jgi:hypothetical protein
MAGFAGYGEADLFALILDAAGRRGAATAHR